MNFKNKIMMQFLVETNDRTFKWGELDCTIWVDDYLKKLNLGIHPYRGQYSTEKEATKLILKTSVSEILDGKFKRTLTPERGDIAMLKKNGAIGICAGQRVAFKAEHIGVALNKYSECVRFWRVE
jgi:hypothetical protein